MVEGVSVDKDDGLTGTFVVVIELDAPDVELWHFLSAKLVRSLGIKQMQNWSFGVDQMFDSYRPMNHIGSDVL